MARPLETGAEAHRFASGINSTPGRRTPPEKILAREDVGLGIGSGFRVNILKRKRGRLDHWSRHRLLLRHSLIQDQQRPQFTGEEN